jgi:hypothetical protein
MAKKKSRIGAIDHEFRQRVMPIFLSWGLERHPNNRTEFGRYQYGYEYEFADVRNSSDIRLCSFAIFTRDGSLAIDAAKNVAADPPTQEIPSILSVKDTFRLARPFSVWRFLTQGLVFRINQRKGVSLEDAAARLIDDVIKELSLLKRYLYGVNSALSPNFI